MGMSAHNISVHHPLQPNRSDRLYRAFRVPSGIADILSAIITAGYRSSDATAAAELHQPVSHLISHATGGLYPTVSDAHDHHDDHPPYEFHHGLGRRNGIRHGQRDGMDAHAVVRMPATRDHQKLLQPESL